MNTPKAALFFLAALSAVFTDTLNAGEHGDFHNPGVIDKIAFGSCNDPRQGGTPMFGAILKHSPDVFVFLGDNIYGDTEDMGLLEEKWQELGESAGFQELREKTTMLATWDDHDYGVNDGGKSYPKREESARIFLDFFKEPADSPRRKREGIYASYTFGTPGRTCQIFLLDTRYFRDELPQAEEPKAEGTVGWYRPSDDSSKTLLGGEQWKWLEEQLRIPADIRIIASSIQVLAHEKGMENWRNVPHERNRLFDLLRKHRANHTFAISGDVHFAELSKMDLGGYPFYDLTSSGLTNTSKGWAEAKNSFRVDDAHAVRNAGLIEIDWDAKTVEFAIVNAAGEKILKHAVELSELEFK